MPGENSADRDTGFLVDMLENARLAITHAAGKTWDGFLGDRLTQDAVTYPLAVVGEAARNVSEPTRGLFPDLPWRKITAMRNILVHDYKGVELKYVWEVVQVHAPLMIAMIQDHLDARGIRPS